MATRTLYWVSGTGNWSDTAHWSLASGGAGGEAVPDSDDDVHFDAGSNVTNAAYTVTVNATASCRDLMFDAKPGDGAGGTITFASSGASPLASNGNVTLLAGMVFSYAYIFTLLAASGVHTLTTNGVTISCTTYFSGAGTWQLQDNFTFGTSQLVLSPGTTFDPNGKTVTLPYAAVSILNGAWTFYNLMKSTTDNRAALYLDSNITVSNLLTLTGTEAAPVLVFSSVLGTPRTITAAAVAPTHCAFMDINGAGTAAPFTGTSIGDCLGNSGITFTPGATQYFYAPTAGTKLWSNSGNWFLGSGGTGGAGRVPLPQDDVIFDAASIGAAGTTISGNMPRLGKDITWTGVTNSPTFTAPGNAQIYVFGSVFFSALMATANAYYLTLSGRGNHVFRSAGLPLPGNLYMRNCGGTYTFDDAITVLYDIDLNGLGTATFTASVTAKTATITVTGSTVNMGSGTWFLSGIGGGVMNVGLGVTLNAQSSTIKLTDASSAGKTFSGGDKAYNNIWLSGAGSGSFSFTRSNTFNDFKVDNLPKDIRFTADTNTTFASFTAPDYNPTDEKFAVTLGGANRLTTPDAVPNQITGDIAFVADIAPDAWANGAFQAIINKDDGGSRQYGFSLGPAYLSVYLNNGVASADYMCTVATPYGAGVRGLVAATWSSAAGILKFFTSASGEAGSWIQLGADRATLIGPLQFKNTIIVVGGYNVSTKRIFRAQIYNGIPAFLGGVGSDTPVVDCRPNDWTSGNTWPSSTTGETWTRNGSALIYPEIKISSLTAATHTVTKTGGGVVNLGDAGNISYSIAAPANTFYAGNHGLNGGNNTNWLFQGAPADLAGAAAAAAAASGALDAGIVLAGVALSVAGAGGTLTTAIPLAAAAVAVSAVDGILNAQITLSGAALAEAAAAAGLDTAIALDGLAGGAAAASGTLTVQIQLSGDAAAVAGAGGLLTAQVQLAAVAIAQALASGSLTTEIPLVAFAQAQASVVADFVTRPRINGYRLASSAARLTQLLSRDVRIEQ